MTATHASTLVLAFALAAAASADDPCTETWADALGAYPSLNALELLSADLGDGTRLYIAGYGGGLGIDAPFYVASFDGSTWEVLGSDFDDEVEALAVFDDGMGPALYAGGQFESTLDGAPMRNLARWDGERWQPLAAELDSRRATALTTFDDGNGDRLIAAMRFDGDDADPYQVVAWDGAQWQILADGIDGYVRDLCVWDDGFGPALYAGGSFEHIHGQAINGLARYRQGAWEQLGAGLGPVSGDSIPSVATLAAFNDGAGDALYVGGYFNRAGATDARNIAKWTGSDWETVGNWTGGPVDLYPDRFETYDDGVGLKLYIGSSTQAGLIAWDGVSAQSVGTDSLLGSVDQFCASDVGGEHRLVILINRVWYWDGTDVTTGYPPILGSGIVNQLLTVEEDPEETLYAAGDIGDIDGEYCHVARRTDDAWQGIPSLPRLLTISTGIKSIAFVPNNDEGTLYITGHFHADSDPSGHVAAWNGEQWLPLGTGLYEPYASYGSELAVYDAGSGPELYVTGRFTSAGGVPARNIASWDGEQWHALSAGLANRAYALATADVGNGERLYVIGNFYAVDYKVVGYIAAWDGQAWHSLEEGFDAVPDSMTAIEQDGRAVIYVAGDFTTAGGRPCNGFAKWDGEHWLPAGSLPDDGLTQLVTVDTTEDPRLLALTTTVLGDDELLGRVYRLERGSWILLAEVDDSPTDAVISDDGTGPALYVGGHFDHVGDLWARGIARRNLCDPDDIAADLNADGFIDQADLGLLLAAYDTCAGDDFYDDRADLTGDACVDHADLGAFLQAYPQ